MSSPSISPSISLSHSSSFLTKKMLVDTKNKELFLHFFRFEAYQNLRRQRNEENVNINDVERQKSET